MKTIRYALCLGLGFVCYRLFLLIPGEMKLTGIRGWILMWAGFYANRR